MKNLVTYQVKPEHVDENERLVKQVYIQLRETGIAGFHYATFKMPDGVTFVHLAITDNEEAGNAFRNLPVFKTFQSNIGERCDVMPVVNIVTEIGTYNFIESFNH